MNSNTSIYEALRNFASAITEKMGQITHGEPEDQLRAPFEAFMNNVAAALGWEVVCTGETPLPGRLGRPDYAVHKNKLLAGYVELKATGVGATASRFKGHNREQFKRFSSIPNILYTDGNEWALYRSGKCVGKVIRLAGDVASDGGKAATTDNALNLSSLLRNFLLWDPSSLLWDPSLSRNLWGEIDFKGFAELLAPLCRMLRDDVTDALKDADSPLVRLAEDWRQLLFPDASNAQFADAYAQTATFALLLGRSEGADPLTLETAEAALAGQHSLLSRALHVLTDPGARAEIDASLDLLLRVIAVAPPAAPGVSRQDPWLYFYEHFLAAYDPKLRKDAGVYYTPIEVVRTQTRLIDDLLVNRLNKPVGFADPGVVTLDPAVGTGTYLLGVIEHALGRVEAEQGAGAVAGQADALGGNLYGFELMVGPYAVAELRVSRALRDRGASLPAEGTRIYLTDTLESPNAEPPQMPFILQPIAEQHEKALKVKSEVPVIVCLGNPPYDRHDAVDAQNEANLSRYGGWVRFGDPLPPDHRVDGGGGKDRIIKTPEARLAYRGQHAILKDFIAPAITAGHGGDVKNLYNLYVYFWRWALWKVFERDTAKGPGIVSFISASSYLDGDAFCGMREHMRRLCDEIWILDLGGEGRGTRRDDNVFAIQTPVAIAVAFRSREANMDKPAKVHYARIRGKRAEKLAQLNEIKSLETMEWRVCPDDWQAPLRPAGVGEFFDWPLLTNLMPWQHSGAELKRTWPIAPDVETLERRWRELLHTVDRAKAFRETGDRTISGTYLPLSPENDSTPIAELPDSAPLQKVQRYAYRSFDRHYLIADGRLMSRPRPELWHAHGERQMYLASLFNHPVGKGPSLTVCSHFPDRHHFRGSYGGKDIIPIYRNVDASEANILPDLLEILCASYEREVTPEDFVAYIYGLLAQPAFTDQFFKELETRELHVPITKNATLFEQVREAGARLLWLHTYGERFVPECKALGQVPPGVAKCVKAVPSHTDGYPEAFLYSGATRTLRVGAGEFAPIAPEVYDFDVSGLKVVQSWLKYRMKKGAGKKSSPLDDIRPQRWTSQFTTELLYLLWVLEATVASYPEQAKLLDAVLKGECFRADELPPVPEEMRKAPKAEKSATTLPLEMPD